MESNRTFMTELYNLRAFHHKTASLMLEHTQIKFAMIVLDFANFKSINEFCVLNVGDTLLKCTADALREQKQMRDYATMALNTIKRKFYAKHAFFDEKMRSQMLLNKMI